MQRVGDEFTVIDGNGNGVNAATVTVYDAATLALLPNVYNSGGSLTTPASKVNPFTTDAVGRWSISLPDGRYNFVISGGNIATYTIYNVCVFDNTVTYPSPALGTVTSIGVAVPAEMTATAAITGAGVVTLDWATEVKNKIFAGPATGADANPTFRVAVLADLPSFGPTATTTFGSASKSAAVTTNAQGIITSISESTITAAYASITGKPTTVAGYGITNGISVLYRPYASVTVGNTTTESTLISATGAGSLTVAGTVPVAGSTFKWLLYGYMTKTAASTLRVKLKWGTQVLLDTTALAFPVLTHGGSSPFKMEIVYTVRTTGAGGTGIGQILLITPSVAIATVTDALIWPQPGFTATSAVDTTASGAMDVKITWGTADAGCTMTVTNANLYLEG